MSRWPLCNHHQPPHHAMPCTVLHTIYAARLVALLRKKNTFFDCILFFIFRNFADKEEWRLLNYFPTSNYSTIKFSRYLRARAATHRSFILTDVFCRCQKIFCVAFFSKLHYLRGAGGAESDRKTLSSLHNHPIIYLYRYSRSIANVCNRMDENATKLVSYRSEKFNRTEKHTRLSPSVAVMA